MYHFNIENHKTPTRNEWVICHRISDEFLIDLRRYSEFGEWLDRELLQMEDAFQTFVTPNSLRNHLGR